ncbi:MAG: hypothetical protein NTU58_02420 [Candidatus Nealsonbacteria bacterium]|nr:hypothetical protein [Candidatus Nealsonbacteria bacterium]
MDKAKEIKASIYTQFDISINPGEGDIKDIKVVYTEETQGNSPPTLRIARGAVYWAEALELEELWIVAAVPHLWRCERDLKYAVREVGLQIDIHICEDVYKYPEDEWYCFESKQIRTRSQKDWKKRENKLKKMPMFIYKRIAK